MKYIHPSIWLFKICAYTGWPGVRLWHAFSYYRIRGRWPNFNHPKDLSEHIMSAMNHKDFEKYADYADKIKVRDYLTLKGYGDKLLDVYGIWERAEDIDFNSLPDKFALKPNNGSGGHVFCRDKSQINNEEVVNQLNKGLNLVKENLLFKFERHYSKIQPRIYAEELIETGDNSMPTDYKFMCVKGKIADCLVVSNRKGESYSLSCYDNDWQMKKNFLIPDQKHDIPIEKPKNWEEMKQIAKVISKDFEFVRVDLYEYKDRVYIGELTFSPQGGYISYYTDSAIKEMGKLYDE